MAPTVFQVQMPGHVGDRHELAQLVDVLGQTMRDPLGGVGKVQPLHPRLAAGLTPHLAVTDLQPGLSARQGQVANVPTMPARVDAIGGTAAFVAQRTESLVGLQIEHRATRIRMNRLGYHFYPWKRKVRCYTKVGHHAPPFAFQGLLDKALDQQKAA